jgi:branched-subunit amino acid aminotransferase/4-amino-4-deoxychorismate lyase
MQARPLDFERYSHLFTTGATLAPVALGPPPIDPHIKHRSRLAWWIAQKQLSAQTGTKAEPLFTTSHSAIRETPTANVLCAIDGALISPPRSEILNGISLAVVEELCQRLGIAFREREIFLDEASAPGGECLLTNSSYCIACVSRIGTHSKPLNSTLFVQLINEWSDLVGVNIREQFFTKR